MRLVTGSNRRAEENKVSIRLRLSGHSFSKASAPKPESGRGVTVELLSMRSMLIPSANVTSDVESLLSSMEFGGVVVDRESEDVVIITPEGKMAALVVVPSSLIDELNELYTPEAIAYTSPILKCGNKGDYEVVISLREDLMVIKVFADGGVIFCDMYEYSGQDDVLYRLARLSAVFDIPLYTINIYGGTKNLLNLLLKYYKDVHLCE